MKLSQYFLPTFKETPKDAHLISHQLMLRAGLIEKISSGLYGYLPLGLKVLRKMETIIRKHMNEAGALECLLPLLVEKEFLESTKRWEIFNKELFTLKDRHERDIALAPTHEEIITFIAKNKISSYKQLPLNFYHITSKFRDEVRPRFGVMRSREFTMKDAYSFHSSAESLTETYTKMSKAYNGIFTELSLDFVRVKADSGAIGGDGSEEFMVKSEVGEDEIAVCDNCNYAANVERAVEKQELNQATDDVGVSFSETHTPIYTPRAAKISEVLGFLKGNSEFENLMPAFLKTSEGISEKYFIKTVLYEYQTVDSENSSKENHQNWKSVIVLIRGDYQINEVKLINSLQAKDLRLASNTTVEKIFDCPVGYLGPIFSDNVSEEQKKNIKSIRIIGDNSLKDIQGAVTGANKEDYHFVNVDLNRDCEFQIDYRDIHQVIDGGKCVYCDSEQVDEIGKLKIIRGIEVGHIFKLQDKYTKAMDFNITTKEGTSQAPLMGCYGIGVNRLLASIVEQNHDQGGIIFPACITPFQVVLLTLDMKDEACYDYSKKIYHQLLEKNIDVLWDDREERAGFKFKDADLVGIPYQVIIGKKSLANHQVETKIRLGNEKENVPVGSVVEWVEKQVSL